VTSPPDAEFTVHLPTSPGALDQDEEFCTVEIDGERRQIRFHEYAEIYRVPGLYEHLFYDLLGCTSPSVVVSLLAAELRRADIDPTRTGRGSARGRSHACCASPRWASTTYHHRRSQRCST